MARSETRGPGLQAARERRPAGPGQAQESWGTVQLGLEVYEGEMLVFNVLSFSSLREWSD